MNEKVRGQRKFFVQLALGAHRVPMDANPPSPDNNHFGISADGSWMALRPKPGPSLQLTSFSLDDHIC